MSSSLIGMVITGLIGILGSLLGSLTPHLWQRRRERSSARAITQAYISGILRMEQIRDRVSWYEGYIAAIQAGGNPAAKTPGSEDDDDLLQPTVIAQIGLLEPDIAGDVTLFIKILDGLRINLRAIALGKMDHPEEKLKVLKKDLALFQELLALGQKLVERLR
jgi:hypothetical protein